MKTPNARLLGNKVLVLPSEKMDQSPGGIYLPDQVQKKPAEGVVVACGSGLRLDDGSRAPLEVSVGEKVIYSKYGGTEITIEGKEYVVLDADQIFVVL